MNTTNISDYKNTTKCLALPHLEIFTSYYDCAHGYIALCVCLLGIVSNTFNVIVLNQPSMRGPINFLLTILAVSDGVLMTGYAPFAVHFLIGERLSGTTYPWAVYMFIFINVQHWLHSTSSYIIVTLAVFRVLYVRCIIRCQEFCSMCRAIIAVVLVCLLSAIITVPCALGHHIASKKDLFMVTFVEDNPELLEYMYWNTAIFVKLFPLICLTVLSLIIIITIRHRNAKMRRLRAEKYTLPIVTVQQADILENGREDKNIDGERIRSTRLSDTEQRHSILLTAPETSMRDKAETRMTRLLLAIVLIFMIAYLPQAILLVLNGCMGDCFSEVYNKMGNFLDMLTLVNSSINFVLYCCMSRQFRTNFIRLFYHWSTMEHRTSQPKRSTFNLTPSNVYE